MIIYYTRISDTEQKGEMEGLKKKRSKILRTILGSEKRKDGTWTKKKKEDVYRQIQKISDTI